MNKNVKSVIGGVLILIGLISIFKGSFLGGLLIGLVGTSIIPVISEKYKEKYPFWRKKVLRRGVLSGVLLLGFVIMLSQTKSNTSYSKEKMLVHYIKNDTLDKSLKNIRELGDIGRLFENSNYATENPHDGYISQKYDSVNKITLLTFNPKFDYSNENDNTSFLKEDNEKGKLKDYIIKFKVDKKDSIISKQTFITYSNGATEEFANNDVPSYKAFINEDAVETQKMEKEAEKLIAKQNAEYNQRADKFEEDCLSSWDGSHTKLKRLIKDNLNDPKSFEHVNTRYKLYKGYAVVVMTYRGKNAFNATVTNEVTAKTNLEDCSVILVE